MKTNLFIFNMSSFFMFCKNCHNFCGSNILCQECYDFMMTYSGKYNKLNKIKPQYKWKQQLTNIPKK